LEGFTDFVQFNQCVPKFHRIKPSLKTVITLTKVNVIAAECLRQFFPPILSYGLMVSSPPLWCQV